MRRNSMNDYRQKRSLNDQKLNIKVARGGMLSSPATPSLVLGGAAVICSLISPALVLQSGLTELISLLVCAICAFCTVICLKGFLALTALAVLASFIVSLTGSTVTLASIIGPIFSIAFISAAMSRKNHSAAIPAIMIPLISYALSLAITRDFILALASLYTLPTALALGIMNRRESSKSSAVLTGTITFSATTVALLAAIIYLTYGSLTPDTVKIASNDLAYTISYYCEIAIDAAGNVMTPEINQIISSSTDTFINMLPGAVVASAYIVSYICQSISVTLSERMGYEAPKDNYITADIYTAIVFAAAYLVSFASGASGGTSLAAVVGSNISLMLTPCLFIVGLRSLKLMPYKLGIIGILFSMGTIILIFVSSSSAFTVFAIAGAAYTVINSVDAWAKQHYSKGENK